MKSDFQTHWEQWARAKRDAANCIVLIQIGDFFETFGVDALTVRDVCGLISFREDTPMVEIPYHAVDGYVARLTRAGHRVALVTPDSIPKRTPIDRHGLTGDQLAILHEYLSDENEEWQELEERVAQIELNETEDDPHSERGRMRIRLLFSRMDQIEAQHAPRFDSIITQWQAECREAERQAVSPTEVAYEPTL